jgi:DNA-binding transcriptional MerR regulator
MKRNSSPQNPALPAYRTGAAARIAGIPVETLRVWERRHRIVGPELSPRGQRRYTGEQVARLALIRQLVDLGHPVSSLASLHEAALRLLLDQARAISGQPGSTVKADTSVTTQVVLVGESLIERGAAELLRGAGLDLVASFPGPARAAAALAGQPVQTLVIEIASLLEEAATEAIQLAGRCQAEALIVLYRFAQSDAIRRLRRNGAVVARLPIDLAEIAPLCLAARAAGTRAPMSVSADPAMPPRFDDRQLAELARIPSSVHCECPRQLAELLRSIGGFERYSAECEIRRPEDRVLHRELGQIAASARHLLEQALIRIAQAEGIAIPVAGTALRPARPRTANPPTRPQGITS